MNITPSPLVITPSPAYPVVVTQTSIAHDIQDRIEAGNRLSAAQTFSRASGIPLPQVLYEQGLDSTGKLVVGGPPAGAPVYLTTTQTMQPDTIIGAYSNKTPQEVKNEVAQDIQNQIQSQAQVQFQQQLASNPYYQKFNALDQQTGGALSTYALNKAQSFAAKYL